MIILGIDPGYATIGYGAINYERGKFALIDYGAIVTPSSLPLSERLELIDAETKSLLERMKPDAVAVEELFFNTNITTGIKVAHARGVLMLDICKVTKNIFEYTPLQIKSTLTGNGTAKKPQIQFMVKNLLNLKDSPKPDDAADALAAAICHALSNSFIKRNAK